jgi:hypothetical protein
VYLHNGENFKAVEVEIKSKTKDVYTVSSSHLIAGAEITIKGVNFLRVIDMDLNSGEEEEEHHD